jgi:glycosyltransferase involved in cell wall biosynthesis
VSRLRLTLLTEIPAPYRIPLFNALAERVDLTVLFLRESNPERPYRLHGEEFRFRWRVLPGRDATVAGRWLVLNRRVASTLRRAQPEALVVGGWNQPAFWTALAWARLRRVPAVLWVESTGRDERSGRLERAKRVALQRAAAFVVPGQASRSYLEALGIPSERISVAPNAVDPTIFHAPASGPSRERPVVLAVGRLSPEKGIDVLLRAVEGLDLDVVVAGVGPEEQRLRAAAGENVRFLGQVERNDLPSLYANADILAMPSRSDPWGMVLNEAALSGLPLVSTTAAGAAHELIEDGANGYVVSPGDTDALHNALSKLVDDDGLRHAMGARSRELALRFTPGRWAEVVTATVTRLAGR